MGIKENITIELKAEAIIKIMMDAGLDADQMLACLDLAKTKLEHLKRMAMPTKGCPFNEQLKTKSN